MRQARSRFTISAMKVFSSLRRRASALSVALPSSLRSTPLAALLVFLTLLYPPAHAEMHTFVLDEPAAHEVFLAGEMTQWERLKIPMRRGGDGKWRASVDLAPGQWLYKFIVDGRWIADPAHHDNDADGQGGRHSFVFIGAGDWSEQPIVPRGQVDTWVVPSPAWGKAMKLNIYLPPGFERGRPYPVLWLLHGSGMDADQWHKTGKVERYMDRLIDRGAVRPFVIVMPSSGNVPYNGISERFITLELPLWLERTYGLRPGRGASGVAGMSMGGLGALLLPLLHPQRYSFSISLSGAFDNEFIGRLPNPLPLPSTTLLLCGQQDTLVTGNRKLVLALQARQSRFSYREDSGGHTWNYWSQRMSEMLRAADGAFAAAR